MLLFLQLNFGSGAHLQDGHATRQLGEALTELLRVVVRGSGLEFGFDLRDTTFEVGFVALARNNGGLVFGNDYAASTTQQVERCGFEAKANLFVDDLSAGEDGDVLHHCLAAVTEERRLYCGDGQRATNAVDDECRERFAFDIFGNDEDRAALLHDQFEDWNKLANVRDLARHQQDEWLV